ncbi:Tn3 family transposase [Sinomonas terrae]|uniref:Tn3 family transposase n=1 Tax=Sinomonas terrae TaxID=2908838 RepID=A0ABS9U0U8_9MICC|nr:Tn3 family transposase [Sinomonas terrae]MCH6470205.1 Tn3 family transposase [Sinomonas terrae]
MTDEGGYGRFGTLSRQELERYCYLDDEDRRLIAARRRDYNRLGFALQVVTVRHLGMFLPDPLGVPSQLVEYLAEQLDIADPWCVKRYLDRRETRFEHSREIQQAYGLKSFGEVESELSAWIVDQAWMTGDGPKAIFGDYGPLDKAARGVIDTAKIAAHWDDMCRIAVSIHVGEVSAHEVTRMISCDGQPTGLGQAIAHFGRIFKTLHILRLADDEPYRREGKTQANLVEGRHGLARTVYHGRKGEMTSAYYEGMEDQLSALGLVLNCIVVWNTVYENRALAALRAGGYPVLDADVERLSAFVRAHIGIDGHYSFHLPDLGGVHRPLRDLDAAEDE